MRAFTVYTCSSESGSVLTVENLPVFGSVGPCVPRCQYCRPPALLLELMCVYVASRLSAKPPRPVVRAAWNALGAIAIPTRREEKSPGPGRPTRRTGREVQTVAVRIEVNSTGMNGAMRNPPMKQAKIQRLSLSSSLACGSAIS